MVHLKNAGSGTSTGVEVERFDLASSLYEYLLRAQGLGLLEGEPGEMDIHPVLKPFIEALHHILAGGSVEITIDQAGHPDIVTQLNDQLERGLTESTIDMREEDHIAVPLMLQTSAIVHQQDAVGATV